MSEIEDAHGKVLPVEPFIETPSEVSVLNPDLISSLPANSQGDLFLEPEENANAVDLSLEWGFSYPDADIQLAIQEALAKKGLYKGKQNGKWGVLSIYAIQEAVSELAPRGWFHKVTAGVPDAALCAYVKKFGEIHGDFVSPREDLVLTDDDWTAFLIGLESK